MVIAQNKVVILGAKSPILTWADWQAQFNPDLASETGTNLSRVFPSSFEPSNALEENSWKPFRLSETEVNALIKEAPEELRKRFSATGKVSSIKNMTLEFSSAIINRSWLDSEVFRSHFWQLSDKSKVLSDGAAPPSGDCPAYVTAIVFARNVVVEQKQNQPSPSKQKQPANLQFNYILKNQNMIKQIHPGVLKAVQPQLKVQPQVMRAQPLASNNIKMMKMQTAKPLETKDKKAVLARPLISNKSPQILRPTMVAYKVKPNAILSLKATTFIRKPIKPVRRPVPRPANQLIKNENIYILAFICKPLSKCPDPDLTLQW